MSKFLRSSPAIAGLLALLWVLVLTCLPSMALLFHLLLCHESVLEATFSSQCLCCSSKCRNEMHQGQSSNGHGQNENADGETLRLPIFLGHVTVPNLVKLSMFAPFWITLITLDLIKWCKPWRNWTLSSNNKISVGKSCAHSCNLLSLSPRNGPSF